jgi:hypothetical protein
MHFEQTCVDKNLIVYEKTQFIYIYIYIFVLRLRVLRWIVRFFFWGGGGGGGVVAVSVVLRLLWQRH